MKRPVDLHVDVLNAQTKEFYAGKVCSVAASKTGDGGRLRDRPKARLTAPLLLSDDHSRQWVEFDTQAGEGSITLTMPYQAQEPFLWKVFLAPRGEP